MNHVHFLVFLSRFSNGPLYKCRRKDTKKWYLAGVRGHTSAADTEIAITKLLHHRHIQRLYDLYDMPTQYTLIYRNMSHENIIQRLARKATYTESKYSLYEFKN